MPLSSEGQFSQSSQVNVAFGGGEGGLCVSRLRTYQSNEFQILLVLCWNGKEGAYKAKNVCLGRKAQVSLPTVFSTVSLGGGCKR